MCGDACEKHVLLVAAKHTYALPAVQSAKLTVTGVSVALWERKAHGEGLAAVAADADLHIAAAFLFGAGHARKQYRLAIVRQGNDSSLARKGGWQRDWLHLAPGDATVRACCYRVLCAKGAQRP